MKKRVSYLALAAMSSLFLTACSINNQTSTDTSSSSTESSSSSSSSVATSSSSARKASSSSSSTSSSAKKTDGSAIVYSDGSRITVGSNKNDFSITLSDGTSIKSSADGSYAINESDGTTVTKSSDGSYAIMLATGTNIAYEASGEYVVTEATGKVQTGNGSAQLDEYLTENGYSTISKYDKQVQDIADYVSDHS